MSAAGKRRYGWLLLGVVVACGCSNEDRDRLARVGRVAADKVEHLTSGANGKLASGWQAFRADLDEMALDARVSARLRWDKTLTDVPIQVHAAGGIVELQGTVNDLAQRRRAVELAESTVGADKVKDLMEVATREP